MYIYLLILRNKQSQFHLSDKMNIYPTAYNTERSVKEISQNISVTTELKSHSHQVSISSSYRK